MRRIATTVMTSAFALTLIAAPTLANQGQGADQSQSHGQSQGQGHGKGHGLENPNVVELTSEGHHFIGLPEEIPSGWTTFRYHNNSAGEHLAYLVDLPEFDGTQITSEHSVKEVAPVFQAAMDRIIDGDEPLDAFAEFADLPPWYWHVVPMGGPGLVAPGEVAETTVYLEPGHYQLECYVKSLDGNTGYHVFHTETMIEDLVVTDEDSGANEPVADFEVNLTQDGIEIDGDVRPGQRTFKVNLNDASAPHGNFLGNSVHIARLDHDTDVDELDAWMNWVDPDGLSITPPATFLGGVNGMPGGSTAYVSVHLTPGEYAFISEVDNPRDKDMLETVSVP